ncbi:MAG: hypothetical protein MK207_02650 [Saprospiraceae bacterium]|nr:hypothetical protein [Saprospiraceae bacterium]
MAKNKTLTFPFKKKSRKTKIPHDCPVPETRYCKTKTEFDEAVGQDFIQYANETTTLKQRFLVGLAHGQSPAGAYAYIYEHFDEIKNPEFLRFTFTNSRLKRQRNLKDVFDGAAFLTKLLRRKLIGKNQILGRGLNRDDIEEYKRGFNEKLVLYLETNNKIGLDYVFLSFDPSGRVAAISRNSSAFNTSDYLAIVDEEGEKDITGTPYFLLKSRRIAFLATKADKRRPLAWLYDRYCIKDQSPSFLRHINNELSRMTVFIDDKALTWPQIILERMTNYGKSTIKVDLVTPYDSEAEEKRPVIILLHGFLGLNSFDSVLTNLSSKNYIGAAMHYGSIPHDLPPRDYSEMVIKNINTVVTFFGSKGHPVYIFDHSMGNTYFMLMDRDFDYLPGLKKYLRGRIGSNPFFCKHAKHACVGFLDNVLLPAVSFRENTAEKTMLFSLRRIIPFDTRKGVRKRTIKLTDWLIRKDSAMRERIWSAAKKQILKLMTTLDSVPHLDRIPIERALNRLPAKIFVIQMFSALKESKSHDNQKSLANFAKHKIPILIIKSENDAIAKYDETLHKTENVMVLDVTDPNEKDLFREHLYHMKNPFKTTEIIIDFVDKIERNINLTSNK